MLEPMTAMGVVPEGKREMGGAGSGDGASCGQGLACDDKLGGGVCGVCGAGGCQ